MSRGTIIITSLALYAFLTMSVPASVHAEEKQPAKDKTSDKTSEAEQEQTQKTNNKAKWKEYILKKHEDFLTWLNTNYPDKYEELMKVLDTDLKKFSSRLGSTIKVYDPIRNAQKHNPPLAKVLQEDLILQHRRDELLKELRNAKEKDREKLLQQIKEVVSTRFDIIIQKKGYQIKDLQKRLERLKKDLEKRAVEVETLKTEKNNNVDKRMKTLLKDTGVDWK